MSKQEKQILDEIERLKELKEETIEIGARIEEICQEINGKWEKDTPPPIHLVAIAIDQILIKHRADLCEVRGE